MPLRRRRPTSPPATPLDDEDLLAEFLLRLPPRPSSLPRAAAVCKAWRRVVTDPHFLHRFRSHHRNRKAPLLGFYDRRGRFFPMLKAPDRVPASRLFVGNVGSRVVACSHGFLLCRKERSLQVFDPMTGDRSAILTREDMLPLPLKVDLVVDSTGVDGICFRLFSLSTDAEKKRLSVSVYTSNLGAWVHSVETLLVTQSTFSLFWGPGTIVGNAFYWTDTSRIIRYDLERVRTLAIVEVPWNEEQIWNEEQVYEYYQKFQIMTKDGLLGISTSIKDESTIHIGVGKTVLGNDEKWVVCKTTVLDIDLPLELQSHHSELTIMWFEKENNLIFLWTPIGIFTINLDSMKFTKETEETYMASIYPYSSFVNTGRDVGLLPFDELHDRFTEPSD